MSGIVAQSTREGAPHRGRLTCLWGQGGRPCGRPHCCQPLPRTQPRSKAGAWHPLTEKPHRVSGTRAADPAFRWRQCVLGQVLSPVRASAGWSAGPALPAHSAMPATSRAMPLCPSLQVPRPPAPPGLPRSSPGCGSRTGQTRGAGPTQTLRGGRGRVQAVLGAGPCREACPQPWACPSSRPWAAWPGPGPPAWVPCPASPWPCLSPQGPVP